MKAKAKIRRTRRPKSARHRKGIRQLITKWRKQDRKYKRRK